LCQAETDHRCPVRNVVEIEAPHDLPILIDEHVKEADTGLLVGQERTMSLSELLVEIVATVADRLSEVRPVRPLKSEDRRLVIRAKTLQFEHPSNLPWPEVPTTGIRFVHGNRKASRSSSRLLPRRPPSSRVTGRMEGESDRTDYDHGALESGRKRD
jgi:hypothetical protein